MIKLTAKNLELRGGTLKTTKRGNQYAIINVENDEGVNFQFYCTDPNVLGGFKKGDIIDLELAYSVYMNKPQLSVTSIVLVVG